MAPIRGFAGGYRPPAGQTGNGTSPGDGTTPGVADFWSTPQNPRLPNPEPPQFALIRDMLFRKMAQLQADPYAGQKFSNMGRGLMDPRTGTYGGGGRGLMDPRTGQPQAAPTGDRAGSQANYDASTDFGTGSPGLSGGPISDPNAYWGGVNPNSTAYKDYRGEWTLADPSSAGQWAGTQQHGRGQYDENGFFIPKTHQASQGYATAPGQQRGPDEAFAPWAPTTVQSVGSLASSTDPKTQLWLQHMRDRLKPQDTSSWAGAKANAASAGGFQGMNPGSHSAQAAPMQTHRDPNNPFGLGDTPATPAPGGDPGQRSAPNTLDPRGGTHAPGRPTYDAVTRPTGAGPRAGNNTSRGMAGWTAPAAGTGKTADRGGVIPSDGGGAGWGAGGGASPAPGGQSTDMPWLNSYGGNFTAPMSPEESAGLGAYGNYAMGGSGTGPSQGYYNNVLNGNYLDFNKNPWLQQIMKSGQGIKDYQDQNALRRIQSSMAAGGNAISGANTQAQSDYLNQSGNNFQNTMGNLFSNQYQNERGLQNAAAQGSDYAGQQYGQGLSNYFNMGSVPRQIQQNDLNAQYGDWNRQMQGAQGAYQYPDYLANASLGHGYPGSYDPTYGSSQASGWTALLQQLMGNGSGGGIDWGSILSGLGSGVGAATSGGDANPAYDAGPTSYKDAAWYNKALDTENAQRQKIALARTKASGGTKASSIIAMVLAALQGYQNQKNKSKANQFGAGKPGDTSGGNKTDKGNKDPFASNPAKNTIYNNPIGPNPYDPSSFVSGSGADQPYNNFDQNAWNDFINQNMGGSADNGFNGMNPNDFGGSGGPVDYNTYGNQGGFYPGAGDQSLGLGDVSLGDFSG